MNSKPPNITFDLDTDPIEGTPEFTITCHTQGGPPTVVRWIFGIYVVTGNSENFNTSQVVLDTSYKSVYENKLHVRGRRSGLYSCIISNNIQSYLPNAPSNIVNEPIQVTGNTYYDMF